MDAVNQALGLLEAFASVGVEAFDVTKTDVDGNKRGFLPARGLGELRRRMAEELADTTRHQVNFIVRPRPGPRAEMIQLDDLAADQVVPIERQAFMVLETSPGNFQAWVAVKDAPADFGRRLRKGTGADPSASGATRIAGSRNFKAKYAPAFPLVTLTHTAPGRITTPAELETAGLVAPIEAPKQPPPRVSRPSAERRRWPSYARCIQNAPPVHQGDRPDVSRADFVWCMTAIDWGWSIEATAARLLEESPKAGENGPNYARMTAEHAAAAVARRNQPAGPEPRP